MPLIVDPQLEADVTRQFNLKGPLRPFELTETVIPIFAIGALLRDLLPPVVTTTAGDTGVRVGTPNRESYLPTGGPAIFSAGVFDSGAVVNPGAGAVLVDTGQLNSAPNWMTIMVGANVQTDFVVEWRNAANAANVATWTILIGGASANNVQWGPHMIEPNANERVRIVTGGVVGTVSANITNRQVTHSQAT